MRLTRAEGQILLGAIAAELTSQSFRGLARDKYDPPLDREIERELQNQDQRRADELRAVRDRIKAQM